MDDIDWSIVEILQSDGRISIRELARQISLSAPATAERVKRLEQAGVIVGYAAVVSPQAVGLGIRAIIRMGCENTIRCVRRELDPASFPEVVEMHRVSGDDCSVIIAYARDVEHLENLIDRLARWSRASTTLILSTPVPKTVLRREILTPPTAH
ncbi:Lrp/AsnC family transcriptional regulator [Nocardioides ginsengisoli]|uniref:Lrp/AsnC family transcriptional regulator n=1 Tax=Nocardioides ginsengisoli TaxID=363868 RepID=A0ABW3W776_9ACTN